jgi:HEAT repeat protein
MKRMNAKIVKIISIITVLVLFAFYAYSYYNSSAIQKVEEDKIVSALMQSLRDGDEAALERAIKSASEIGEPAVKPLISALENENMDFRKGAADALAGIGEPAVKPLINALDNKKQQVRRSAAYALTKSDPTWPKSEAAINAIPELINDLKRDDKSLREDAVVMLAKIGTPAVKPLIKLLDDNSWEIREYAASALWKIKDPSCVEPLTEALKDDYWQVRRTAAYALGKIGDAAAMAPLRETIDNDGSVDVRIAAKKAYQRLTMLVDTTTKRE